MVYDPSGKKVYTDGFNQSMECKKGYYWSINFFSLDTMFRNLYSERGSVPTGQYKMDVYFDRLWTGSVKFMVNK